MSMPINALRSAFVSSFLFLSQRKKQEEEEEMIERRRVFFRYDNKDIPHMTRLVCVCEFQMNNVCFIYDKTFSLCHKGKNKKKKKKK